MTGTDCFVCQPKHLEEQWAIHRPIILELGRHGIQSFDCDPAIAPSPFETSLPPATHLVGSYDVLYVKWETIGAGDINALDFGDVLQKRAIHGSLQLSLPALSNDDDQDGGSIYSRLLGVLELPKSNVYARGIEDQISDLPANKKIAFRFSDGGTSSASINSGCISVLSRGEEALAYVEDLSLGRETNWEPRDMEAKCTWKAYYGSSVSLQVMREKTQFEWVPRDDCSGTSHYAQRIRQEISNHQQGGKDWSNSWLCRHKNLPENVCKLVHGYVAYLPPCFKSALLVEEGDLWISMAFVKAPRFLHVKVLARRRKA